MTTHNNNKNINTYTESSDDNKNINTYTESPDDNKNINTYTESPDDNKNGYNNDNEHLKFCMSDDTPPELEWDDPECKECRRTVFVGFDKLYNGLCKQCFHSCKECGARIVPCILWDRLCKRCDKSPDNYSDTSDSE